MPYCKISHDVKLAAIKLFEHDILPLEDILECVGFHKRTFYHVLALWRETGDIVKHINGAAGWPRLLHFDDIDYLLHLIQQWPDWFLDELLALLRNNRFITVHYVTIHNSLVCAGVSLKKLKKIASEWKEDVQNEFIECISVYEPDKLGFLDETSKNEKMAACSHGRANKGKRAMMKQHFVRGQCLLATGLLTVNGIAVTKVVEGSMTREMYLDFLEHEVASYSRLYKYFSGFADFNL